MNLAPYCLSLCGGPDGAAHGQIERQKPEQLRPLSNRHVHRGIRRRRDGELSHLTDDAHDFAETASAPHEVDPLPNRVLVAEELTHEQAIDDGDRRRVGSVTIVEKATADKRDAHRAEVVARNELFR